MFQRLDRYIGRLNTLCKTRWHHRAGFVQFFSALMLFDKKMRGSVMRKHWKEAYLWQIKYTKHGQIRTRLAFARTHSHSGCFWF